MSKPVVLRIHRKDGKYHFIQPNFKIDAISEDRDFLFRKCQNMREEALVAKLFRIVDIEENEQEVYPEITEDAVAHARKVLGII